MMTIIEFNERLNDRRLPILHESRRYDHDTVICNPSEIAKLCADTIGLKDATEEYFYLLAFDTKLHLLGISEIAHGGKDTCHIDMKVVFERALLLGSSCIAVCHNHPSGDCTPSQADCDLTEKVKECCNLLQIGFIDHVIVGDEYYSFSEGRK